MGNLSHQIDRSDLVDFCEWNIWRKREREDWKPIKEVLDGKYQSLGGWFNAQAWLERRRLRLSITWAGY